MKKIIFVLMAVMVLASLSSCTPEELRQSYSIRDALKISAWVFDENVEGNYYHDDDAVYTLEVLKLNEVRLMAPIVNAIDMKNLNIHLKFDGIIEVVSEDKAVQLSANERFSAWHRGEADALNRTFGFNKRLSYEGYVAANPLVVSTQGDLYYRNLDIGGETINLLPFKVGSEYILNVNAYRFENQKSPIIRAQLKLVQLEDTTTTLFPRKDSSPCFSVELISYEYNEIRALMDDIWDDEYDD